MNELFAGLETYLYIISTILFYPVIIILVGMTFWIVFSFGVFLRDWAEHRRGDSRALEKYRSDLHAELERFRRKETDVHPDVCLERLLQKSELSLIKALDSVRFVVRAGPALGLMGTLIPMGVALSSMAQGDMPAMAQSMVTAFTTTVVGLGCGVAGYLISMVREKWVRKDIREMEYETELATRNIELKSESSGGEKR